MGKVPAFWQVFGPALVATAGLLLLTLFHSLHSDLTELRRDLDRTREHRLALVTTAEADALLAEAEERLAALEGDPSHGPSADTSACHDSPIS